MSDMPLIQQLVRVDQLLVEQGLVSSRAQAQVAIKAGRVRVKKGDVWLPLTKSGVKLPAHTECNVTADEVDRFVSRGALKLAGAIAASGIDVSGMCCLDVGQSTGGFTDYLLQSGAARVVGVDVGHDQLHPRLRADERVVCYEGINARELPSAELLQHTASHGFDLAVMDVSFISQTKILPSLVPLIRPGGHLISLVKPQFEVGKAGISKGGILREPQLFIELKNTITHTCKALGLSIIDYLESPIQGGDGNREFLLIAMVPAAI